MRQVGTQGMGSADHDQYTDKIIDYHTTDKARATPASAASR